MHALLICAAAFGASGLTFFSGFGLGTLLLPVFAIFFPMQIAVALTALVHLGNNLFKLALLGPRVDRAVLVRFGPPAIVAAFGGALVLRWLSDAAPWWTYTIGDRVCTVLPIKLVVAALMLVFAVVELVSPGHRMTVAPRWLPLGGLVSGFFGGLSGHQGAFRSVFLLRCGLSKEGFLATGVAIACGVDLVRLAVYAVPWPVPAVATHGPLLMAATLAAMSGALLGNRLVRKVTLRGIQRVVAGLLFAIAITLGSGVM